MRKRDIFFVLFFIPTSLIFINNEHTAFIFTKIISVLLVLILVYIVLSDLILRRDNFYLIFSLSLGMTVIFKVYYAALFKNILISDLKNTMFINILEDYYLSLVFFVFIIWFLIKNNVYNKKRLIFLVFVFSLYFIFVFLDYFFVAVSLITLSSLSLLLLSRKVFGPFFYHFMFVTIFIFLSSFFGHLFKYHSLSPLLIIFYYDSKILIYYFSLSLFWEFKTEKLLNIQNEYLFIKMINENKSKLFSIFIHDIKNMLQGILGICQLIRASGEDRIEKEHTYLIESISIAMNNSLSDFLSYLRSDFQGLKVNNTDFNLNKLVYKVLDTQKDMADMKNITICNDVGENVFVFSDINIVEIIIRNLVNNAVKYGKNGGLVKVSIESSGDSLKVKVSDNGIGFSKEFIEEINSGVYNQKSGLGLFIIKDFLQKIGEELTIESYKDRGSVLSFNLPISKNF